MHNQRFYCAFISMIFLFATATWAAHEEELGCGDMCQEVRTTLRDLGIKIVFPKSGVLPNILAGAKSSGNIYFLPKPLREIFADFAQERRDIEVDCQLFIQIAHKIHKNRLQRELYKGKIDPNFMSAYCDHQVVAYIAPRNKEAAHFLQKTALQAKGQWVIKDGQDRWTGLQGDGSIVTLSSEQWRQKIGQEFQEEAVTYCQEASINDLPKPTQPIRQSECAVIEGFNRLGAFDDWEFSSSAIETPVEPALPAENLLNIQGVFGAAHSQIKTRSDEEILSYFPSTLNGSQIGEMYNGQKLPYNGHDLEARKSRGFYIVPEAIDQAALETAVDVRDIFGYISAYYKIIEKSGQDRSYLTVHIREI